MKLIKTRLRSTVGQNRLESLVLLSTEKDITIDYNEAIDKFALTSDLLTKELMFKQLKSFQVKCVIVSLEI